MARRKKRSLEPIAPAAQPAATAPAPPAAPAPARLWAFRAVSAVALPLLLLGAGEAALRLAGVGHPAAFTVPCVSRGQPAFCGNARFVEPFFPPGATRSPPAFAFPAAKAPGTVRIFVLGESAALGDPEPAFGFSRYLEVLLADHFPGVRFEVINAATTAINSHALLPMARDLARRQPDLLVIYAGNNEVVGPFGAGTAVTSSALGLPLFRARIALQSTRLGQLLVRALQPSGGASGGREWRGMETFAGQQVPDGAPGLERVAGNFRENLRGMVAAARGAGARVVLSTVAVNLRDSAPFGSLHRAGLAPAELAEWNGHWEKGKSLAAAARFAEALPELKRAEQLDDRYAALEYLLARSLLATDDAPGARARFARARDLDVLRFRADGGIEATIREVAAAAGDGVELVDAEAAFAASSPGGVPGAALFWEHVHLTPEGNDLLARTLFPAVVRALPEAVQRAAAPRELPEREECDRRLSLSGHERRRMARELFHRLEAAPFTGQVDHEERLQAMRALGDAEVEPAAATAALWRQAIARAPEDPWLAIGLGAFLAPTAPAEAASLLQSALALLPTQAGAREVLAGALGKLGRHGEAITEVSLLLQEQPDFAPAWVDLGYLQAQQGGFDEAADAYQRAAALAPSLAPGVLGEVGRIRAHQGRFAAAALAFRQAIALDPREPALRLGLVQALESSGRIAEAQGAARDGARALRSAGRPAEAEALEQRASGQQQRQGR